MEWEYKIVHLEGGGYFGDANRPTEAGLNELGAEGWELAASLVGSGIKLGGRGGSTSALVFKRPVEAHESENAEDERTFTGQ